MRDIRSDDHYRPRETHEPPVRGPRLLVACTVAGCVLARVGTFGAVPLHLRVARDAAQLHGQHGSREWARLAGRHAPVALTGVASQGYVA